MNIKADLDRFPTRLHEDWRYFRMKKEDLEKYLEAGQLAHSNSHNTLNDSALRQLDSVSMKEVEALFRHDAFQFQDDTFSQLVKEYATPGIIVLQGTPEIQEIILSTERAGDVHPADIRVLLNPGLTAELTLKVNAPAAQSFISAEVRVYLSEGSSLKLNLASSAAEGSFAMIRTRAQIAENAQLLFSNLQTPDGHIRSESHFNLTGPGADLKLHQAVIADGSAINDTVLKAIHSAPETTSDMNTITYGAGKSRCALNGLIHVKPGSENVSAYQQARNYILSSKAFSVGYPQLEIENQNVSCSHGTTMHSFDENQLFYLNSRGISPKEAKQMILRGNLDYFFRRMNEPQKKQFLKMAYTVIGKLSI
jgi:Fe-S cluster assembly scaffold protein SufB